MRKRASRSVDVPRRRVMPPLRRYNYDNLSAQFAKAGASLHAILLMNDHLAGHSVQGPFFGAVPDIDWLQHLCGVTGGWVWDQHTLHVQAQALRALGTRLLADAECTYGGSYGVCPPDAPLPFAAAVALAGGGGGDAATLDEERMGAPRRAESGESTRSAGGVDRSARERSAARAGSARALTEREDAAVTKARQDARDALAGASGDMLVLTSPLSARQVYSDTQRTVRVLEHCRHAGLNLYVVCLFSEGDARVQVSVVAVRVVARLCRLPVGVLCVIACACSLQANVLGLQLRRQGTRPQPPDAQARKGSSSLGGR